MDLTDDDLEAMLKEDFMDYFTGIRAETFCRKVYDKAVSAIRKYAGHCRVLRNRKHIQSSLEVLGLVLKGAVRGQYETDTARKYFEAFHEILVKVSAARAGSQDARIALRDAVYDLEKYQQGDPPWILDDKAVLKVKRACLFKHLKSYRKCTERLVVANHAFAWAHGGIVGGEDAEEVLAVIPDLDFKIQKLRKTLQKWEMEALVE